MQEMRKQLNDKKVPPKTLDFSGNKGLSLISRQIIGDDGSGVDTLFQALDGYTAVTTLNLRECGLGPESVTVIATQLQHFGAMPNLSTLDLAANPIRATGAIALAELIGSGKVGKR